MSAVGIELRQPRLYRCDVAEYALLGQMWKYLVECIYGVFYGGGVYHEVGRKFVNLLKVVEPTAVECEQESLGVGVIDGNVMLHRQYIAEERTHFPRSDNQNLHVVLFCAVVEHFYLLAHRLLVDCGEHRLHEFSAHAHLFGKLCACLHYVVVTAYLQYRHSMLLLVLSYFA